jgi:hypothetical protein
MDIWTTDKLVLFFIFFLPGFISLKVYDLLISSERRDFSQSLFEVLAFSAINFAALSWLIILIHSGTFYNDHELLYFLSLFSIIFLAPVFWPIVSLKLLKWPPIAKHVVSPIQKPWDYVFGKRQAFWTIVHLKDGRKIGGRYDTNSFASSNPAEEQIYLEELWELDEEGNFIKPIARSRGMIILGKEIMAVEFFE